MAKATSRLIDNIEPELVGLEVLTEEELVEVYECLDAIASGKSRCGYQRLSDKILEHFGKNVPRSTLRGHAIRRHTDAAKAQGKPTPKTKRHASGK